MSGPTALEQNAHRDPQAYEAVSQPRPEVADEATGRPHVLGEVADGYADEAPESDLQASLFRDRPGRSVVLTRRGRHGLSSAQARVQRDSPVTIHVVQGV